MQRERITIIRPKAIIRLVYRQPFAGGVPGGEAVSVPDEYSERVVRVNGVAADGLSFAAICLRRQAEGQDGARTFRFDRVVYCEPWNGEAVRTMGGFSVVPGAAQVAAMMEAGAA